MVLDLPDRLLRILHIDDDEDGFVLMRDLLSSIRELNVEIEWISTFNDALERLSQNEHDLCLLDYLLGERDGISVLKDARAQGCRVPIIMLTGSGNRYVDLEAMQSGASYYIDKYNLDKFDIERAIRYSLEHARLLREVEDLNEFLEERIAERTQSLVQAKQELENEVAERERVEAELKQLRAKRERQTLEQMAHPGQTTVTSRLFGIKALQETAPQVFDRLVSQYADLMDLALERRAYRINENISDELHDLAVNTGSLRLSPRDIVEIHNTALKSKQYNINPQKAEAYVEEGRLMLLELMGYLTAYYRNLAFGTPRSEP